MSPELARLFEERKAKFEPQGTNQHTRRENPALHLPDTAGDDKTSNTPMSPGAPTPRPVIDVEDRKCSICFDYFNEANTNDPTIGPEVNIHPQAEFIHSAHRECLRAYWGHSDEEIEDITLDNYGKCFMPGCTTEVTIAQELVSQTQIINAALDSSNVDFVCTHITSGKIAAQEVYAIIQRRYPDSLKTRLWWYAHIHAALAKQALASVPGWFDHGVSDALDR
jgi:hypothetical protein